jgi:hypothetical protein
MESTRTPQWKMEAYAWIKNTFGLKAKQRDALDVSEHYEALMLAGHAEDYSKVQELLVKARIISYNF